jgi:uncharacterized protein (TIGR01777 family)
MEKKSIVITGGTGLIGLAAKRHFLAKGYALRILSRSHQRTDSQDIQHFQWNPAQKHLPLEALQGADAIIHLAGAPIAERWTAKYKGEIIASRVQSAQLILEVLQQLPQNERPKTIVSASAVGWYPSSTEWQSENAPRGAGFIGDVTEAWEDALSGFRAMDIRSVSLRIGLVLSKNGGFLGKIKPIFSLGLGSGTGDGKHWQSWIHLNDVIRMLEWTIEHEECQGIYNATAPIPETNSDLSRKLAHAMGRPFWAPNVPAFVLRMVFGEMSGILLASHRMNSSKIVSTGYEFEHPELDGALQEILA